MGSINNELKMSRVSLNHQQFTVIWQLIPGCKLPSALPMNMISIFIFPEKTLINTITLFPIYFIPFHVLPWVNVAFIRISLKQTGYYNSLKYRTENKFWQSRFVALLQSIWSWRCSMCKQSRGHFTANYWYVFQSKLTSMDSTVACKTFSDLWLRFVFFKGGRWSKLDDIIVKWTLGDMRLTFRTVLL